MFWGIIGYNGLIYVKKMTAKFKSKDYLQLLKDSYVPYIRFNTDHNFLFVQDNCPIHKTSEVQNFLLSTGANIVEWPSRSPDLNIIENVWSYLSELVYEDQPRNLKELECRIYKAVNIINCERRHLIRKLYDRYSRRLINVLMNGGKIYK